MYIYIYVITLSWLSNRRELTIWIELILCLLPNLDICSCRIEQAYHRISHYLSSSISISHLVSPFIVPSSCFSPRSPDWFNISYTSWWFQPIWKICSSNCIISPGIGMEIKSIWNHHLLVVYVDVITSQKKPFIHPTLHLCNHSYQHLGVVISFINGANDHQAGQGVNWLVQTVGGFWSILGSPKKQW